MKIYQFLYCDCVHESAYATISLHRTRKGAENALAEHKASEMEKFEESKKRMHQHWLESTDLSEEDRAYMIEDNENHTFGVHQDWAIGEQELNDDTKNTPMRVKLNRDTFLSYGFTDLSDVVREKPKNDGYEQYEIAISPSAKLIYAKLGKQNEYMLQELHGSDNDGDFTRIITMNHIIFEHQLEELYFGLTREHLVKTNGDVASNIYATCIESLPLLEKKLQDDAGLIGEAVADVSIIAKMNTEQNARDYIHKHFIVINRRDCITD